jgi:hypothetical protein
MSNKNTSNRAFKGDGGYNMTSTIANCSEMRQVPSQRRDFGRLCAAAMWTMLGLVLRVLGQVVVAFSIESGGDYYPLWYECADGVETIRWLKRQPWFNGQLATWGGSYFGYTRWFVSDQTDPAPSAMMIELASSSFYVLPRRRLLARERLVLGSRKQRPEGRRTR